MRLIDADAQIQEIDKCGQDGTIANYVRGVLKATLKNVPTVDAELVRHGRWIKLSEAPEWDQRRCSVCGEVYCCQGNYCPNCGAKMDGDTMRLIDADKLISDIKSAKCADCDSYGGIRCRACETNDALNMIDEQPTDEQRKAVKWDG